MPSLTDTSFAGSVESIVYESNDGFRVIQVLEERDAAQETRRKIVGKMPRLRRGERVHIVGTTTVGQRGPEIRASVVLQLEHVTDDGLARSIDGMVRGVGSARAARIVRELGGVESTVDKLSATTEPEALAALLPWLQVQTAQELLDAWRARREEKSTDATLASLGITENGLRQRIAAHYGTDAPRIVLEDPYRLIRDVGGVGFARADDIALRAGSVHAGSDTRLVAAAEHCLRDAAKSGGHTCLPEQEIAIRMLRLLCGKSPPQRLTSDPSKTCANALTELSRAGIAVETTTGIWATTPLASAERSIAVDSLSLCDQRDVPWLELVHRIGDDALSKEQMQAIADIFATRSRVAVLTGGPGTGKSTVSRVILTTAEKAGLRAISAAPTAMAAKRTGPSGLTVHRLLGAGQSSDGDFARSRSSPIEADLVLVDESSMLDVPLAAALFSAIAPDTRLLLIGDENQLPPVGPGAPFRDLAASGRLPVGRLRTIHRQADTSRIIAGAHELLTGRAPRFSSTGDRSQGCMHHVECGAKDAAEVVSRIVLAADVELGVDPRSVLVLSPTWRGAAGVDALNERLGAVLNPRDATDSDNELRRGGTTYRVGDRVRHTRNDYLRGVVNGDVGAVSSVDGDRLVVSFDANRRVSYRGAELDDLVLAFCSTVHAAQGGEAEVVVVVLLREHVMVDRTLLYTALTRARRACVVVGERAAVVRAARRRDAQRRRTNLGTFIAEIDSEDSRAKGGNACNTQSRSTRAS